MEMTTEHVSVPREFTAEEVNAEAAYIAQFTSEQAKRTHAMLLSYAAILSRATPSDESAELDYAKSIATSMWDEHYAKEAPKWELCDDLYGVLSQIDNMLNGLAREKPTAPRVVTADQVIRAWEKFYWTDTLPKGWKPTQRDMQRMTEVLEDFATSLPAARVPDGLIQRLKEISEWEITGVLCDGELRKDARELSDRFGQPHSVTIDIAKRDAWKQAADFLLTAAPQAGERG